MHAKSLMVLLARPRMQAFGRAFARRYRDLLDRDEVTSAIDLGLLNAADRFDRTRGPFFGFATIWVRREIMALVRRELRWAKHRVSDDGLEVATSADSPHEVAERRQLERLIEREGHSLWRAHLSDGLSLRELARRYGLSLRQIQARLSDSRKRLTKLVTPSARATPGRARKLRT